MEIRPATAADTEALRSFWESSVAEITFAPYPGTPFAATLLEQHSALVAEQDGRPVGAVYANFGEAQFAYVFGLYVLPESRRHRVARRLMSGIAALARERGRDWVVLTVDTPNAPARELYERLGFDDAARLLRAPVEALLDE